MKTTKKRQTITIIGAGLSGCFMAILMAKRGYKVDIYERYSAAENRKKSSNRSFNLTFYSRGVEAIKKAGIWKAVEPTFKTLQGAVVHPNYSKNLFSKFDYKNNSYYVVPRATLVGTLMEQASKHTSIRFHFNTAVTSIDRYTKTMTIQNMKTKKYKTVICDVILGADGVHSKVRSTMQEGQHAHHTQEYYPWTYKQIYIHASLAKKLAMKKNVMHVWPRKNAILIAFPNADHSFTAMLTLPKDEELGFSTLRNENSIRNIITEYFPDMTKAIPVFTESILKNPEGSFVSIYTTPWFYKDFMAIVGDAAHGMLPFYGQGMSTAFDDCLELASLIEEHNADWGKIFPIYQANRKPNTDVITNLSKESFNRFRRDKEADYGAIHDKVDAILHSLFPKFWLPPLYVLVATDFSPFTEILKKSLRQRKRAFFLGVSFIAMAITGVFAIKKHIISFSHSLREYFQVKGRRKLALR